MVPGSPDIQEVIEFAKTIQDNIDLLHVSRGNLAINKLTPYIFPPIYMEHDINIEYAAQFKRALDVPVSVVGAVTLEQAETAIAEGKVDLIALGRQLIADPETVNKLERGQEEEIRPCIRCNTCISRSHFGMKPPRCAVNPMLGRELDYQYLPAPKSKKRVVVVGGGPAGLESARTLAGRGHDVIVFEKSPRLGGLLWEAGGAAFKTDLRKYLEWSVRMTKRYPNIDVRLSTRATPELIAEEKADALIIAIGATPNIPKLTCQDKSKVVWVGDLERDNTHIGENILIAGAGLTGCETALKYLQVGKTVTLIDVLPRHELGLGSSPINAYALFNLLEEHGIDLRPETRLMDVTEDYVVVKKDNREEKLRFDTIILALGNKVNANDETISRLRAVVTESYIVGDRNDKGGTLWNATTSAFDVAMAI
jgi:NADPH-dependent 2,4-dienoyl-CoA reductase/sulfur reductase-like enzyme